MPDRSQLTGFLTRAQPAALEMLQQMVGINSFTLNRDGVNRLGKLTAEYFRPLGFSAEFVPSAFPSFGDHLVLTRPGASGRSIAMITHLDTVFPPEEEKRHQFHWRPEGDRIYGPGTHDIKGGTAMIWLVLSALQTVAPSEFQENGWQIFGNSSEEMLSADFGDVCRRRFAPGTLAALVFESEGRLGEELLLVVSRKGRVTWRVTITGRGAHAGNRHRQGVNAVLQAAHLIPRLAAITDYANELTCNVATVAGGTVLNRVPHEAVVEGEVRAFTPDGCARAKEALLALAGPGDVRSVEDRHACQVAVEILSESRPWPRNPATDQLAAHWESAGRETSIPVGVESRGGLSDGNLLWDIVPTLDGLGPWGENDHCSERSPDGAKLPEFVDVTSFIPKAALNVRAILSLLRGGKGGTKS